MQAHDHDDRQNIDQGGNQFVFPVHEEDESDCGKGPGGTESEDMDKKYRTSLFHIQQ